MQLTEADVALDRTCPTDRFLPTWRYAFAQSRGALTHFGVHHVLNWLSATYTPILQGQAHGDDLLLALRRFSTLLEDGRLEAAVFARLTDRVWEGNAVGVWNAVCALINRLDGNVINPSDSSSPGVESTFNDTYAARRRARHKVFQHIEPCTYRGVEKFCAKLFAPYVTSFEHQNMIRDLKTLHRNTFPESCLEADVADWLQNLEVGCLQGTPTQIFTWSGPLDLDEEAEDVDEEEDLEEEEERHTSVFFQKAPPSTPMAPSSLADTRVVGYLKQSSNTEFQANITQLAVYVRDIFRRQPLRHYIHAFLMCGSTIEFCLFDRSGVVTSPIYDVRQDFEVFAMALVAYATMQDVDLGLDDFVETENGNRYVTLTCASDNTSSKRIQLGAQIFNNNAIVTRGTTCFEAVDADNGTEVVGTVKLAWPEVKDHMELDFLQQLATSNIDGLIKLKAFKKKVASTATVRAGLDLHNKLYRFRDSMVVDDDSTPTSSIQPESSGRSKKRKATLRRSGWSASGRVSEDEAHGQGRSRQS